MKGWVTWTGAVLISAAGIAQGIIVAGAPLLPVLPAAPWIPWVVGGVGLATVVIGLGRKIEK